MDSLYYDKRILKPNSKALWIPDEFSLHCNDKLDSNDPNRHIAWTKTWQELRVQKSTKKWNKKLKKSSTYGYLRELEYVWGPNPARAGLEVFNHGEIQELHKEFEKVAVRRYIYKAGKGKKEQSVILRLATAKPVIWSNGKWQDIEVVDKELHKRFKEMVSLDNKRIDWRILG